jgi:3-dehydroquinate dehydratase / shikimate dehydrogenase
MGLFGKGVARVCAVVAGKTAVDMADRVRAALRETPTVEVRLDLLSSDRERTQFLHWLGSRRGGRNAGATFIATCRRRVGGGAFSGDAQAELYWLMQAREAGCEWCDIEIETVRELRGQSVRQFGVPPRVMLSVHDFERTPALPHLGFCPRVRARAGSRRGQDGGEFNAVKVAAFARNIGDSVRLLEFGRRSRVTVTTPMGETGLPARVLALREGIPLVYAPVAESTAPGQVSLLQLIHLYRAHELTKRTRVFGIIGDPVGHSLSPLMHNTGFIARKVDAVYLPFLVSDLGDFLRAVPALGVRGFSVTLPHKQKIMRHLAECDGLAADIGAVNTVTVGRHGSLHGCNTDYIGVLRALERKVKLAGSHVLIFGAGGAARAAAFALSRAGAHVFICARRESAARQLARAVGGDMVPRRGVRSERFDAILNATPIGMHPHASISPLQAGELHCRIVMDLIYRPQQTRLLRLAATRGLTTVSGVEMFLAQGLAQWEIFTGRPAPQAEMRRAVIGALRSEKPSPSSVRDSRGSR